MHHLVLSQSTRVTVRQTDRQNYDSQDRPRIDVRAVNIVIGQELMLLIDLAAMTQNSLSSFGQVNRNYTDRSLVTYLRLFTKK